MIGRSLTADHRTCTVCKGKLPLCYPDENYVLFGLKANIVLRKSGLIAGNDAESFDRLGLLANLV